jgi:hypothetical protein
MEYYTFIMLGWGCGPYKARLPSFLDPINALFKSACLVIPTPLKKNRGAIFQYTAQPHIERIKGMWTALWGFRSAERILQHENYHLLQQRSMEEYRHQADKRITGLEADVADRNNDLLAVNEELELMAAEVLRREMEIQVLVQNNKSQAKKVITLKKTIAKKNKVVEHLSMIYRTKEIKVKEIPKSDAMEIDTEPQSPKNDGMDIDTEPVPKTAMKADGLAAFAMMANAAVLSMGGKSNGDMFVVQQQDTSTGKCIRDVGAMAKTWPWF